jgi:3-oxoacyl-[acyl-carrier protein] reductase
MQADLSGQVALVTGAARNIGQAIADRLAANGAHVVYSDLDLAEAQQAAARRSGCLGLAMDVTQSDQIDAAVERTLAEYGRLDILVNNAGVNTIKYRVPIDEFPKHEWDRLLSVDLTGLYQVSHAVAKIMRRQKSGRIINIASIVGITALRAQCAFAAAKAGVIHLTKAMSLELGPAGILVNAIAPGSILTDGTKKLFYGADGKYADSVEKMLAHVALGRPGTSDEIAVAALFLAAPDNSYTTGHILTVDGGWTAGYAREF